MAMTLHIDIVSAEKALYSGRAEMVVASGILGEVGIAPGHAPFLTFLKPGEVRLVLPDNHDEIFYISGGILEVAKDVTVLADTAIRADDLDEVAALEARERAEKALQDRQGEFDYAHTMAELKQAVAQLQAIQHLRKKLRIKT